MVRRGESNFIDNYLKYFVYRIMKYENANKNANSVVG